MTWWNSDKLLLAVPLKAIGWGQESEISGSRRRPILTPWEKNSWGSWERRKIRKKNKQHNEGENGLI